MIRKTIAVLVGSLRKESYNRKMAKALTALAPESLKLEILEIGGLPLYNEDLENNNPQPEAYIGNAANLFDEKGNFANDSTRAFAARYMEAFAAWVETNSSNNKQ